MLCNPGAVPEECTPCTFGTYSGVGATACTGCGTGLGTLEKGSDSAEDCIGMLMDNAR